MKRLWMLFVLAASAGTGNAQKLFLQPWAGLGITNTIGQNPIYPDGRVIAGYGAGAVLARDTKRLTFSAGLTYLTTGYGVGGEFVLTEPQGNPIGTVNGHYHLRLTCLGVPLAVGYRLRLRPRLQLVPSLGVMPAYIAGAREHFTSAYQNYGPAPLKKGDFDAQYRRTALFGQAQLKLDYTLARRVHLLAGPSYRGTVTNLHREQGNFKPKERHFTATMDIGMGFGMGK